MNYKNWFFIGLLGLFLFQNCGSFEGAGRREFYSYKSKPNFFYDVKLISTEVDESNRVLYRFDFAIAYANAADEPTHYQINFSTLSIPSVCAPREGVAVESSKHFRFDCRIPTPEDLYIQLVLVGPNSEQVVEEYRF